MQTMLGLLPARPRSKDRRAREPLGATSRPGSPPLPGAGADAKPLCARGMAAIIAETRAA